VKCGKEKAQDVGPGHDEGQEIAVAVPAGEPGQPDSDEPDPTAVVKAAMAIHLATTSASS